MLNLTFVNEEGKEVTLRGFRVQLESTQSDNTHPIVVSSSTVTAPPGIYRLTVRAVGYQPYSDKVILRGTDVKHTVKLTRNLLIYPVK